MKKMLIVYPNNFLQGMHGTNSRVYQLVSAFKQLGYNIDQFGYENFSKDSSFVGFDKTNSNRLISNLYLYDFIKGYNNLNTSDTVIRFTDRVKRKLRRSDANSNTKYLQDWAPDGACRLFNEIIEKNIYDVVVVFYTYLANLLKNENIKAKKIYFMEDSMFLQQYSWDYKNNPSLTLGKLLDEELDRLKFFDEIFCISYDEKIMYEKFIGKEIHFLPHIQPESIQKANTPLETRKWDVMFLGFNNPFNVEGMNWFVKEVYPHLNPKLKLVFVGSATYELETTHSNIDIIPFAPDLDEIFDNTKVSICPMFRGTGMKIKVVESMAKGIPIVCNERGIDGFPDKMRCGCFVTQDPTEFAEYLNKLVTDQAFYKNAVSEINEYYGMLFNRSKYLKDLKDILC